DPAGPAPTTTRSARRGTSSRTSPEADVVCTVPSWQVPPRLRRAHSRPHAQRTLLGSSGGLRSPGGRGRLLCTGAFVPARAPRGPPLGAAAGARRHRHRTGIAIVSTDGSTDTIVAGVDLKDPDFAGRIRGRMADAEKLLIGELSTGEDFLTEPVLHLAEAGGKRFRPMFTLLASEFGPEPDHGDVVTSAVVLELVHLATLYHDDVMDEASMRRGAQSANSRWSNTVAILSGDYLFAQA